MFFSFSVHFTYNPSSTIEIVVIRETDAHQMILEQAAHDASLQVIAVDSFEEGDSLTVSGLISEVVRDQTEGASSDY